MVRTLAGIGGMTLLGQLLFLVMHPFFDSAIGTVEGPGGGPAVGAPVFLDRGHGTIERYVTDSAGRFTFALETHEIRWAQWLLCVPGGIPMVGSRDFQQLGPTHYGYTAQEPGRPAEVRAFGWRGPIPRECVAEPRF